MVAKPYHQREGSGTIKLKVDALKKFGCILHYPKSKFHFYIVKIF